MEEETSENVAGSRIEGTRKCDERTSSPFIIYQIHTTVINYCNSFRLQKTMKKKFIKLKEDLVSSCGLKDSL